MGPYSSMYFDVSEQEKQNGVVGSVPFYTPSCVRSKPTRSTKVIGTSDIQVPITFFFGTSPVLARQSLEKTLNSKSNRNLVVGLFSFM